MVGVAAALALVIGGARLRRGPAPVVEADRAATTRALRELTVLGTGGDARAVLLVGADKRPLEAGMAVAPGLELRAPASGEVRVGTADGTRLTLEASSELSVTDESETQRFALRAGAIRARVARLLAGQRFISDTAPAEIEVHGPVFRVAVVASAPSCGEGSTTRVSVSEGVVSVRVNGREVRVTAGDAWPTGCESTRAHAERSAPAVVPRRRASETEDATAPPPVAPKASAVVEPATARAPSSDLAAENDLFAEAVRAKRRGRLADAAHLFDELISTYPRGPLVESATVQRMKVLSTIDAAAGARAAQDYLARFPNGFARPEAQALASATRP